jgi:P63C domain
MAKKKKTPPPILGTNKTGIDKVDDRQSLPSFLIRGADEEVLKQYSDYQLDRANEKFKLLSGVETSWKELFEAHLKFEKFINSKIREWEFTFPEELYRQWRRLNGWDMDSKIRPMIFAYYTVRDIYGSLPKEVYPTLEGINEYVYPGIRAYRYCQLVTEECHEDVREIIKSAIKFAESSKDLYEYRVKLASKYGKPFSKSACQLDAFRDNNGIVGSI